MFICIVTFCTSFGGYSKGSEDGILDKVLGETSRVCYYRSPLSTLITPLHLKTGDTSTPTSLRPVGGLLDTPCSQK